MTDPRRGMKKRGAPHVRAAPFRCRLVVMAKVPMAGVVKTRLAREIGEAGATRFARQTMAALLLRLSPDRRWATTLAVSPDATVLSRCWPRGVPRVGQGGGDLGRRMHRLMERMPPGPVVIVGPDAPGITSAHIAEAFRRLGGHDAVFGPATDGGYWLVGLKRRPRLLSPFAAVRWSSPHALADTLANLEGKSVACVATLGDVDDARGLAASGHAFGRRVLPRAAVVPARGRG